MKCGECGAETEIGVRPGHLTPYACKSCGKQQVFYYQFSEPGEGKPPAISSQVAPKPASEPGEDKSLSIPAPETPKPVYRRHSFWEGVLASLFAAAVLLALAWFAGSEVVRGLVRDEMQKVGQKGAPER